MTPTARPVRLALRSSAAVLALGLAACGGSGTAARPAGPPTGAASAASAAPTPAPTTSPTAPVTTSAPAAPPPSAAVTAPASPRAVVPPKPPVAAHPGSLAGKTVVLDPGHDGGNAAHTSTINALVDAGGIRKPCNTTGTSTNSGYAEHALTWAVANQAAADLRAMGATVVLTRGSDTGVGPCIDVRAATANAARADATVSIHGDGAAASARGFHVIEPALAPDHGNAAVLATSAALAIALRNGFAAASGVPYSTYVGHDALIARADLGGLNLARVPAVFIEMGNMRNANDAALMQSASWRADAAQGIANGIATYLLG